MSFRDVQILFAETLDQKQDQRIAIPGVITDEAGQQSGSGSFWFNRAERRVWVMPLGGTQPAPKFCPSGLEPMLGLGVILGYPEGSREQQILRADDDFFQRASTTPSNFTSLTADDLGPGGKQFLWLQPKAITTLAVWPGSGLKINVNPGDYSYQGTRKTFGGVTGYDLTSSKPSSGQHRLVGIYLNSSNTLQIVNGTAVSTSAVPSAPAWPGDAFRLATVRLTGSSTSIDFVGDIGDMRLLWGTSSAGIWPAPGKVNIGATEYSSLTAALSAAVAGDVLILGVGTHTLSAQQTLAVELTLVGVNADDVIISGTVADLIKITGANCYLKNLTIQTTASGNPSTVRIEAASTLENVIIRTTSSGTDSYGILVAGSGTFATKLINCDSSATGGSGTKRALIVNSSNATVDVVGGEMGTTGPVYVVAGTCRLLGPRCPSGSPSATSGWYYDSSYNLLAVGSPNIGSVNQPWGSVYLAVSKDVFASNDGGGLFNRGVNWGMSPTEHWAQGTDQITWTGWAGYTGYITPNNLSRSSSLFRINNDTGASPGRAFYYKSPPGSVSGVFARVGITALCEAGIMIDDGNNNGDGNGANNFVRLFIQQITSAATAPNVVIQYRSGGGAVTSITGPNVSPLYFYLLTLAPFGTKFSNWNVSCALGGPVNQDLVIDVVTGLSWTPARVGLYYRNSVAASARRGVFDFYGDS